MAPVSAVSARLSMWLRELRWRLPGMSLAALAVTIGVLFLVTTLMIVLGFRWRIERDESVRELARVREVAGLDAERAVRFEKQKDDALAEAARADKARDEAETKLRAEGELRQEAEKRLAALSPQAAAAAVDACPGVFVDQVLRSSSSKSRGWKVTDVSPATGRVTMKSLDDARTQVLSCAGAHDPSMR